ncbi:MAG: butyrate kinase [Mogibacterium sp.]|nr:butyrate kinase [Mogibacterium sp.]
MATKVFVINPGSTSTKLAMFEDGEKTVEVCVEHDAQVLLSFDNINDQLPYRMEVIKDFIKENNIDLTGVDAIVGRGGVVYHMEAGVYEVNDKLMQDTINNVAGIIHPSSLGIQLGAKLQEQYGGRLFTVNPVCVDEYCDEARVTGIAGIRRKSVGHALNLKGTIRRHCDKYGLDYYNSNIIACHIDGGIAITAHKNGYMIDGNNACGGDGPFTPTRTGSIGVLDLLDYLEAGHSIKETRKMCAGAGGFVSYFGSSSGEHVKALIAQGNKEAEQVWNGFCYNLAKGIASLSATFEGKVDAIILTGRYVRFEDMVESIKRRCGWLAPIYIYPGEVEHEEMAEAALRVVEGIDIPKVYQGRNVSPHTTGSVDDCGVNRYDTK